MLRPIITAAILSVLGADVARAQTVREWFRAAPCSRGVSLQPDSGRQVIVDEANGYLRLRDFAGDLGTEQTFAVFRKADGGRVFVCQIIDVGDDGSSMQLDLYELRGGRVVEVARPLVPRLDLADFLAPGTPPPARKYREVNLRYTLPRVGTTVRVEPKALDGEDALFMQFRSLAEIARYRRLVETRRYRAIELSWDRARGVFTVGRKIPR
jgi:hypothetical protein